MRAHAAALYDPIQHDYEVIRPIVLCAETAAERRRPTGVERTVVGDKARRFVLAGMDRLRDRRPEAREAQAPGYPDAMAGYLLYLKPRYPPIHLRAIARLVHRKFGYKTTHHTLKRFLAPYAPPNANLPAPPWRPLPMPTTPAGRASGWRRKGGRKSVWRTASSCRGPMSRRFSR